jgi:DNA-binding MarR family transcriptional regulator
VPTSATTAEAAGAAGTSAPIGRLPVGRAFQHLGTVWARAMGECLSAAGWPADAGFRPGCVGVMLFADRLGRASQKELSDAMGLDPSDVVGLIDILEAAGLVARERDETDRRRYAIVLTPLGRERAQELRAMVTALNEELLSPLDADERASFVAMLGRLVEHHRRP